MLTPAGGLRGVETGSTLVGRSCGWAGHNGGGFRGVLEVEAVALALAASLEARSRSNRKLLPPFLAGCSSMSSCSGMTLRFRVREALCRFMVGT